jgi:hypothetical protein
MILSVENFKKLATFAGNNDLANMLKNNTLGYSNKKVIGTIVTIGFMALQFLHWTDANGMGFLGIDAALITSIYVTHAVANKTPTENKEENTST